MSPIKKLLALILLVSFTLVSLLSPFAKTAHAQPASLPSTWYSQEYNEWLTRVFDINNPEEIFGERYTYAQVEWVIYSLATFIIYRVLGGDQALLGCVINHPNDLSQCADEFAAALASADSQIHNKKWLAIFTGNPVSSVAYFKDIGHRLRLVPEVKAQQAGFGFQAANMIQELWRLVRNLAYFLLIIATVVLAFMIMFRVRTSPQTVISVQSAIPKVIIALILITFSYAIAGLLIDAMYVVIGLMSGILTGSGLSGNNWGQMFLALTGEWNVVALMFRYFTFFLVIAFVALQTTFGNILGIFGAASIIFWLILVLIIAIVLILATFRIWFMLLRTFVTILFQIIISPILILLGVLGFGGFGPWVRNMAANLAVFPMVGFMLFIAFLFLRASLPRLGPLEAIATSLFPFNIPSSLGQPSWIPPLTWGTQEPDILWLAISIIVITLIPRTAEIIRGLMTGRPFAFGTAIGEAFAMPLALGGATWGGIRAGGLERTLARMEAGGPGVWGRLGGRLGVNVVDSQAQKIARAIVGRFQRG